jgi:hypothetical protein
MWTRAMLVTSRPVLTARHSQLTSADLDAQLATVERHSPQHADGLKSVHNIFVELLERGSL